MKARVWIRNIKFSDGSKVDFDPNQITVFVGPNNAGKSASLKEINLLTRFKEREGKVVKNISIGKEGTLDDLLKFVKEFSIEELRSIPGPFYKGYKFELHKGSFERQWSNIDELDDIQPAFINLLTTEERLTITNPPESISLTNEAVRHPIHFIQKDDSLEFKFCSYFRQAFNEDLIVHRNAGRTVPLYIGTRPIPKSGEDRVSINYQNELEKLPLLHEQGDGMRSFVGVLLSAFISNHTLLLIDEPEAFLHPPQAKLLGKMLAKDLPPNRQLFLATHSGDFLKGLLEADVSNLKIVRIQREGEINRISVLNNEDIKELWGDPLLRHSNILDGLFHSKVIICESDSDCRFYSAILQKLFEAETNISPDFLFIHCGGKQRVPSVIKALKKLNVKINAVLDFDVLNNISPIKEIFEELGGKWGLIEKNWKIVKTSIDSRRPEMETQELKKELVSLLEGINDRLFPDSKVKEINNLLKKVSAWSHAKQIGKNFIPSGDPTQAYQNLIYELNKIGFLVVEVGELESFVKSVGNHGPKWVNEVLTKDLVNDPELNEAREFVKKLI